MSFLMSWISQLKNELSPSRNSRGNSSVHDLVFSILFSILMFSLALRVNGVGFFSSLEAISVPTHFLMSVTGLAFVLMMLLLKTVVIQLPVLVLGGNSVKETLSIISSGTAAILPVISVLLVPAVGLLQVLSKTANFSGILGSSYEVFIFAIGLSAVFPLLYLTFMEKRKIEELHELSGGKSIIISAISNLVVFGVASAMISSGLIWMLIGILAIPLGGDYIP